MKNNEPHFLSGRVHTQTSGFEYIDYQKIVELVKKPKDLRSYGTSKHAKESCPWFLPSDSQTKKKPDVEAHNNFTALVVDIDEGNWSLDKVIALLEFYFPNKKFIIYSTIKHCLTEGGEKHGNRWRVVVPLASSVDLDNWKQMQQFLTEMFSGDSCATRSHQISYLPARYKGKYEYYIGGEE